MNPHNNKYRESDSSETSMDQDSEASLIIIPDAEDSRNTLYSTTIDEIVSNSGRILDYTQILPDKRNCKSTETSFIEDNITEDYSNYSSTLSKTISENLFYNNEIIEPYPQTFSMRPANLGDQLIARNVLNDVHRGENSSNYTINLMKDTRTVTPYLCENSSPNMNNSSQNYQSSCKSIRKDVSNTCPDKTKKEICEGKSKVSTPKACKIRNDSNISLETKRICASIPSNTSTVTKPRPSSSITSLDTKRVCASIANIPVKDNDEKNDNAEAKHSCMANDAKKCCLSVSKAPKCDPETLRPAPKKEREVSCCSIAPTAKKSLSDFRKCPYRDDAKPKSSNSQNKLSDSQKCPFRDNVKRKSSICLNKNCAAASASSNKRDSIRAEKVMSCTGAAEEKSKECKNKPSYCSNTMILSESATMVGKRCSILNLDKCPSNINIENMQYIQAESQDRLTNSMDEQKLSAANLLTESQRNINAYYGFNSKPRNMPNCMKVKIIPSTTNLTHSALNAIKTKVDRNETIPTCKVTSDDFTSMAKGFFGCIYAKTKDATTYITRESVRLLDSVNHKAQSCNTDDALMPAKVYKDKSIETPLSYLKQKTSLPFAMVDQGTSKNEKSKHGAKFGYGSPQGSYLTVNLCSCSRKYKSPVYSNIAVQEPPQQSNSMFTAIKSKIFSIFREDDTMNGSYKSKNSKSSTQSVDLDDSDESETVESMLPKRN